MCYKLLIILALFSFISFGFAEYEADSDLFEAVEETIPQDEYLIEARAIINKLGNLYAAKNCLLKSFTLYQNAEAAFILGKIHLFGISISDLEKTSSTSLLCNSFSDISKHENYIYFIGNYTEEQSISSKSPNLSRASIYFTYAHHLGNADAGVFLYYIYKQSQILKPDKILIPELKSKHVLDAFATSRSRGSLFANLVQANNILTCNKLSRKKSKEVTQLKNMFKIPSLQKEDIFSGSFKLFGDHAQNLDIADQPCPDCVAALTELVLVLSDGINDLQQSGAGEALPPRLDVYHQEIVKNGEEVNVDLSADLEIVKQHAEGGDLDSQIALGEAFYFGNPEFGIDRDLAEAQRYYAMAAEQNNNAQAQSTLGIMKMQGIGTEVNETEAIELLVKSAEQGEPSAMNALGYAYLYGTGVEQNSKLGIEWMEKAALLNNTESEGNLGALLMHGTDEIPVNETKALFYLLRAARKGQIVSILNIVLLYVEKEDDKSFEMNITCWEIFFIAREAALSSSSLIHHQLLAFNSYREKEFDIAYVHYSLAALLGFVDSAHASAFLWEKKRPEVFKCRDENSTQCALAYYYQLYLLGNEEYFTQMGDLLYDLGQATDSFNLNRSYNMYNYSVISRNDPRALHSLAWMLENGIGTERNVSLALKYYEELANGYLNQDFQISAFIVGLMQQVRLKIAQVYNYLFH